MRSSNGYLNGYIYLHVGRYICMMCVGRYMIMGVLAIFITDTVVHHHLWVVKELIYLHGFDSF